jgi:hypothetical protein
MTTTEKHTAFSPPYVGPTVHTYHHEQKVVEFIIFIVSAQVALLLGYHSAPQPHSYCLCLCSTKTSPL